MPDTRNDDPFDLTRFVVAQKGVFEEALSEVKNGHKTTHWMWFVFPQLRGLGRSSTAQHFGITGSAEARAYLAHEELGPRLLSICEAALAVEGKSATQIFGQPDDMKLRSCATLFALVSPAGSIFHKLIEKYFNGNLDRQTVELLDRN